MIKTLHNNYIHQTGIEKEHTDSVSGIKEVEERQGDTYALCSGKSAKVSTPQPGKMKRHNY